MPSSEHMSECRRVCVRTPLRASTSRRGAGHHVAGVLLVTRRVGDDERAPRRRKEAISDIDRDALLALVFEPVEQ